jgi:MFS family permease
VTQRPTNVRYIVLFGLCFIAGLAYVHRLCLGAAETTIRADLHLTKEETGRAMGLFFWFYAFFQIPAGLLANRWGARRAMPVFATLGALTLALGAGTMILGTALSLAVLIVSRALMGIAQAGLFPASTKCIAAWFPESDRAFASGALQAFMSIGAAIGSFLIGPILTYVYWPWLFVIFAVPGVLWSLWFIAWYRESPDEHRSVNQAELDLLKSAYRPPPIAATDHVPWLKLATRPQLLWLCASQFFRAGANVFWLTWCATYLQETFAISQGEANPLTSIPFMGVVLGSYGGGVLADRVLARTGSKVASRNGVANVTAAIGVGFFLLAWLVHAGPYVAIVLLFFAAVFSSGANPCTYSVTIDIGGKYIVIVFGAMNMVGNFGAGSMSQITPLWTNAFGSPTLPLLMALSYFLGMICWFFVNPNGTLLEEPP